MFQMSVNKYLEWQEAHRQWSRETSCGLYI